MKILCKHIALLLALTALCASGQQHTLPQPTSLPIGSATVADLKGEVTLHLPNGGTLTPQRDLVLAPESTIETGKGSVLLNLRDGSQALVKSHSNVVLKSPETGIGLYLELLLGKLIAKVQKRLGEAPQFRLGTPSAVITVRGTRFEVEVTKKKRTYVRVFEGVVEVQGLMTGGRSVLIRPGFSTEVDPDRDPEQPRKRTQETRDFDGGLNNRQGSEIEGPGRETEGPEQERTQQPQQRENEARPN